MYVGVCVCNLFMRVATKVTPEQSKIFVLHNAHIFCATINATKVTPEQSKFVFLIEVPAWTDVETLIIYNNHRCVRSSCMLM